MRAGTSGCIGGENEDLPRLQMVDADSIRALG
jgi:hypothetical protein